MQGQYILGETLYTMLDYEKNIYLMPGEFFWGDKRHSVTTVLGSCVSICLWHSGKKIGGMCHYKFPGKRRKKRESYNLSYGDDVIWFILENVKRYGTEPREYEVKIFGGSCMFNGNSHCDSLTIGYQNIQAAFTRLKENGFYIKAKNVGGTISRKIYFNLATGEVVVRKIKLPGKKK